ncbi:MAG: hypothetical protein WD489_09240 [Rhodovibrionaceae bacterium]
MSTTGIDSWAVDLAEVTTIYPFQGSEVLMVVIGVVLWLLWHVWQIKHENDYFKEKLTHASEDNIRKSIEEG